MKYRGFLITSCRDTGIERVNWITKKTEVCEGWFCEVYPADDDQYADQLDTFCLAVGHEISEMSEEALEAGIRKYIDENFDALRD